MPCWSPFGTRSEKTMITLYDAFVPSCVQLLRSVSGLSTKAEAYCAEKSLPPEAPIGAKLAPDMLEFAYQVKNCSVHSIGAMVSVERGNFSPDQTTPPNAFVVMKAKE